MATTKKTITIFGATGLQGGSVAAIFLDDPKLNADWTVRAVTRDVTKEGAKKLASQGAQVVAADLNDKSSLRAAVDGAYAVFAVTNYWEKMDKDVEVQQGKNLVDAAAEAGVQHFIWSSVLNINKCLFVLISAFNLVHQAYIPIVPACKGTCYVTIL